MGSRAKVRGFMTLRLLSLGPVQQALEGAVDLLVVIEYPGLNKHVVAVATTLEHFSVEDLTFV